MRVAMYYNNKDIRIEEQPKPQAGKGELVMRIEASGICGSDVMEWYRIKKAPLVLGHEVAGVVDEIGQGVTKYKKGDRIVAAHHVPCNTCHYCQSGHHTTCDTLRQTNFHPGGFAEYVRLPAINVERGVFKIPEGISFEEATFTEPLACVLRGQRQANIKKGQSVLVIGSGIAGLLHIKCARALGAGKIFATDIDDFRLDSAKKFGADFAVKSTEYSPAMLQKNNDGRLADLVILCAGATSAVKQALESVERGGTILFFAPTNDEEITVPINKLFWRNEVTMTSSYAGSEKDHLDAMELIRSKKVAVKDMITHRFGLKDTVKGFQLTARPDKSIKIIIEPHR
ncbi:MAG: alcohol dehydrogenase catalytic domain-containing protein [Planctomycetes bacterium]|nr:alcohol dehydrogenase catalytic domain-containing protein [Planctomycetota bacterium]